MSLSVPALLAAALDAVPMAVVPIDNGSGPTVAELDRQSRTAAGALLAAGLRTGAAVRVASTPGLHRSIGLLAAWRAGLVVNLDGVAHLPDVDAAEPLSADVENLLDVAESLVWSQTPAVVTSTGTTVSHADLIGQLDTAADPAELIRALVQWH